MPKLWIIGASHTNRIARHLRAQGYEIINRSRIGANYSQLDLTPFSQASEQDIVICCPFSNSVLKKSIEIEHQLKYLHATSSILSLVKWIHLTSFIPENQIMLNDMYEDYADRVKNSKAKVFTILNPYRHLLCCESHNFAGLFEWQKLQNKLIKDRTPGQIINCIGLLRHETNHPSSMLDYQNMLIDNVHFRNEHYYLIAQVLSDRCRMN